MDISKKKKKKEIKSKYSEYFTLDVLYMCHL